MWRYILLTTLFLEAPNVLKVHPGSGQVRLNVRHGAAIAGRFVMGIPAGAEDLLAGRFIILAGAEDSVCEAGRGRFIADGKALLEPS